MNRRWYLEQTKPCYSYIVKRLAKTAISDIKALREKVERRDMTIYKQHVELVSLRASLRKAQQ